jgi:xylulokinase
MTPGRTDVVIGLDLGTSGLKAVAVAANGEIVARATAHYPTARPVAQASEQDPAAWLAAVRDAVHDLAREVSTDRWRGIGLSAMIPTLVTTDAEGQPVGPAITWEDGRAEEQAVAFRDVVGSAQIYEVTGQVLDGRYLLPMLLRLQDADPERFRRTERVVGAKDFLYQWLTDEWSTDPSTATGFGCYDLQDGAWSSQLRAAAAKLLNAPLPGLPDVRPATFDAPLTAATAAELGLPAGLPVVLGAADSVLAALALGVSQPGDVAYVAGTSTVILAVSSELILDPAQRYLVTPMAEPGSWGLEMDLMATGSAIGWLATLFGVSEAELIDIAGAEDPRSAPTFLPYVAPGEQGALWDPLLSGTITGLSLQDGRGSVARSLLTGLIVESRRCLSVIAEVTGVRGDLRLAGTSASSPVFQQDLADATGYRVLEATSAADHSALGAALVAGTAVDLDVSSGSGSMGSRRVIPDPRLAPMWDDLATRHDKVLAAVRGLPPPVE